MFLRKFQRELIRLVVLALVAYAGIAIYVLATEDQQVFPAHYQQALDTIPHLPPGFKPVDLLTADGVKLVAHETTNCVDPKAQRWCIFFAGQWGRVRWDLPKIALLRELGCQMLVFDYRGYGESAGVPSETGFYRDADAAYGYLTESKQVPPSKILLVAHSLGTGVAIDLASRRPVGGLILDGAFESIPAMAADRYSWLPVRWLAHNRFASGEKVSHISAPKLFLHAKFDGSIPIQQGRAVFARATGPKIFVALEGRHEDFQWSDPDRFKQAVSGFIIQLPP